MPPLAILLAAVLLAELPQVDVLLLSGQPRIERAAGAGGFVRLVRSRQTGRLLELTSDVIRLQTAPGRSTEIPVREAESLDLSATGTPADAAGAATWLRLADGSILAAGACEVSSRTARITSPQLGDFSLPRLQLAAVRFQPAAGALAAAWSDLVEKQQPRDLLVVHRRGNALDTLEGAVAGIDAEAIRFLVDGEQVAVPRGKAFGVVLGRAEGVPKLPHCTVRFADGSSVHFQTLTFDGAEWSGTLAAGANVAGRWSQVESITFGRSAAVWLSELPPRKVEFTPLFDDAAERSLFRFRTDRNLEGQPLRLGGNAFRRGLWIHSKTHLAYRLGGEYRRFQAVAGIDDAVAERGWGEVRVAITGRKPDDRTSVLWEADVRAADKPLILDLDVTDVIELEVLVDFGGALNNVGDHFVLADAKLLR